MKVELLKRLPALIFGVAMLVVSTGAAYADTTAKPYIKTFGSDVMSGGWFYNGLNCSTDTSSNYQDSSFAAPGFTTDARNGGILAYSKTSTTSSGGDSSQYAVFSAGEVDGRRAGDGFYSAGAQGAVSVKTLTFANTDGSLPFGGQFEGSVRQSNCIPDYYSRKPTSPSTLNNALNGNIPTTQGGNFVPGFAACTPNVYCLTQNNVTIAPGTRLTIYVNGNVYINNNITYDSSSTVSSVPKFALIVKGSIYIDKTVTELDGLYVAQPAGTTSAAIGGDDGVIWTCHPNTTARLDYTYPSNCTSPLVVNGALIAKQVNFLRVNGDITTASTGEDVFTTVGSCTSGTCNVSEVVNYTPAMIMGGDFFHTTSSSSTSGLPIDGIKSLPPVF